jgi:hypothetical protein
LRFAPVLFGARATNSRAKTTLAVNARVVCRCACVDDSCEDTPNVFACCITASHASRASRVSMKVGRRTHSVTLLHQSAPCYRIQQGGAAVSKMYSTRCDANLLASPRCEDASHVLACCGSLRMSGRTRARNCHMRFVVCCCACLTKHVRGRATCACAACSIQRA